MASTLLSMASNLLVALAWSPSSDGLHIKRYQWPPLHWNHSMASNEDRHWRHGLDASGREPSCGTRLDAIDLS